MGSGEPQTAKVCVDQGQFCCLAEFSGDIPSSVFSLGVFSGDHYKDGSVAGHFRMEMCTLMKCDPNNSSATCRQDETRNYSEEWRNFLTTSDAIFSSLKLSATFSTGAGVFPEVLFDGVSLQPHLVNITSDGVLSLVEGAEVGLVSMSLFGRTYQKDADWPQNFCPGSKSEALQVKQSLLIILVLSIIF